MTMPTADEVYDAGRDAIALLRAMLAGSEHDIDLILANCQPRDVARTLAGMSLEALRMLALASGVPEAEADGTVDRQLVNWLQQPDDPDDE
jgi:hypothetical protein